MGSSIFSTCCVRIKLPAVWKVLLLNLFGMIDVITAVDNFYHSRSADLIFFPKAITKLYGILFTEETSELMKTEQACLQDEGLK